LPSLSYEASEGIYRGRGGGKTGEGRFDSVPKDDIRSAEGITRLCLKENSKALYKKESIKIK